jgi:hypothetical protein
MMKIWWKSQVTQKMTPDWFSFTDFFRSCDDNINENETIYIHFYCKQETAFDASWIYINIYLYEKLTISNIKKKTSQWKYKWRWSWAIDKYIWIVRKWMNISSFQVHFFCVYFFIISFSTKIKENSCNFKLNSKIKFLKI